MRRKPRRRAVWVSAKSVFGVQSERSALSRSLIARKLVHASQRRIGAGKLSAEMLLQRRTGTRGFFAGVACKLVFRTSKNESLSFVV